jgi:ABC-type Na+ efflux pump permease subunit
MTAPTAGPAGTAATPTRSGNTLSIVAMVLGGIAVFFVPILFGPAAIVCAVVAKTRKERLSTVALVVAVAGMLLGFALGALVFAAAD